MWEYAVSEYFVSLMVLVFFCLKRESTTFELSGLECCSSWSIDGFLERRVHARRFIGVPSLGGLDGLLEGSFHLLKIHTYIC